MLIKIYIFFRRDSIVVTTMAAGMPRLLVVNKLGLIQLQALANIHTM